LGLFTGGLGGVFLLGMLTKRASGKGAVFGIIGSGLVQWGIVQFTNLNLLLYTMTGLLSCVIIGYLVSLVLPEEERKEGLTIK